jgi:ATP-dependent Clp protease ATP-binding subunit ClpA
MLLMRRADEVDVVHTSDIRPLDPTNPAGDTQLTVALRSVAASARRRALRDGDRQTDTAHLLHSLLETDPRARDACGAQLARVLCYLAQRSIGYGIPWQGSVEDSGALTAASTGTAGWSPAATAAMRAAVARANSHGRQQADGADLLAALIADPHCRALKVLRSAGVDVSGHPDGGPVVS